MKKLLVLLFALMFTASNALAVEMIGKWTKDDINVYIEENRNAYLMEKAFGDWESATNKRLTFEFVDEQEDADIVVLFVEKCSDKAEHAVGLTYPVVDHNGHFVSAKIEIAKFADKSTIKLSNLDLTKIMRHEVGHALGLEHTNIPYSIMNPTIDKCLNIGKEDIKIFKEIYGEK